MSNLNRYHLLRDHFNSFAIACNCNPVYGEICIIELGKNVEAIMPVEFNHLYLRPEEDYYYDYEADIDPDECYPEMPDYYMCVWFKEDFTYENGFSRRWLDMTDFTIFKLANDPTCAIGNREGYCSEIDYEAS